MEKFFWLLVILNPQSSKGDLTYFSLFRMPQFCLKCCFRCFVLVLMLLLLFIWVETVAFLRTWECKIFILGVNISPLRGIQARLRKCNRYAWHYLLVLSSKAPTSSLTLALIFSHYIKRISSPFSPSDSCPFYLMPLYLFKTSGWIYST